MYWCILPLRLFPRAETTKDCPDIDGIKTFVQEMPAVRSLVVTSREAVFRQCRAQGLDCLLAAPAAAQESGAGLLPPGFTTVLRAVLGRHALGADDSVVWADLSDPAVDTAEVQAVLAKAEATGAPVIVGVTEPEDHPCQYKTCYSLLQFDVLALPDHGWRHPLPGQNAWRASRAFPFQWSLLHVNNSFPPDLFVFSPDPLVPVVPWVFAPSDPPLATAYYYQDQRTARRLDVVASGPGGITPARAVSLFRKTRRGPFTALCQADGAIGVFVSQEAASPQAILRITPRTRNGDVLPTQQAWMPSAPEVRVIDGRKFVGPLFQIQDSDISTLTCLALKETDQAADYCENLDHASLPWWYDERTMNCRLRETNDTILGRQQFPQVFIINPSIFCCKRTDLEKAEELFEQGQFLGHVLTNDRKTAISQQEKPGVAPGGPVAGAARFGENKGNVSHWMLEGGAGRDPKALLCDLSDLERTFSWLNVLAMREGNRQAASFAQRQATMIQHTLSGFDRRGLGNVGAQGVAAACDPDWLQDRPSAVRPDGADAKDGILLPPAASHFSAGTGRGFRHLHTFGRGYLETCWGMHFESRTGLLWCADYATGRIHRFDAAGHHIDALSRSFHQPRGLFADSRGRVWVCEAGAGRLTALDASSGADADRPPWCDFGALTGLRPFGGAIQGNCLYVLLYAADLSRGGIVGFDPDIPGSLESLDCGMGIPWAMEPFQGGLVGATHPPGNVIVWHPETGWQRFSRTLLPIPGRACCPVDEEVIVAAGSYLCKLDPQGQEICRQDLSALFGADAATAAVREGTIDGCRRIFVSDLSSKAIHIFEA